MEKELHILELMQDFRSQGKSYQWIATYLTERKIPTKNGGKWYPATVRGMLGR